MCNSPTWVRVATVAILLAMMALLWLVSTFADTEKNRQASHVRSEIIRLQEEH